MTSYQQFTILCAFKSLKDCQCMNLEGPDPVNKDENTPYVGAHS
jgi:hypothetical protein